MSFYIKIKLYNIMIKGLIHQEDLTTVNIDALNIRVPKDTK